MCFGCANSGWNDVKTHFFISYPFNMSRLALDIIIRPQIFSDRKNVIIVRILPETRNTTNILKIKYNTWKCGEICHRRRRP